MKRRDGSVHLQQKRFRTEKAFLNWVICRRKLSATSVVILSTLFEDFISIQWSDIGSPLTPVLKYPW
ncbi:hypothetical protein AALO_G00234340 [Alosa alosa]|uniref:Uncharacterized protein n=1 Tax=Alosa alosa TaxID=278164 RepID=A0AAV6FXW1_9TELE|nr:hypothetical protein AALO_G00234340 [Alosa alosa]